MSTSYSETDCLRRLLDVTRRMAATTDLDELLRTIVDVSCEVLQCERATVFLYDADRNELYSRAATNAETIRFPSDRGIAGTAAQQRVIVNVPDAYADQRFNQDIDRQTGYRTRNLLTFPLENIDGELTGVLQALNKRSGPFTAEDVELVQVLRAQAGVALQRQFLLDAFAQKERMARDLEIARRIQHALFPEKDPEIAGYEVAGWNQSADETGGDCYDFIHLDDGRLAVLLADATGHGIGAALIMAQCRALVRALFTMTDDLARIAARSNRVLLQDLTDDRFVTAFVGVLDSRAHRLEYVAAGQGPLLLLAGESAEVRGAGGVPLAVLDEPDLPVEAFDLEPGALVALLTDGFFEAANPAGEPLGIERIVEVLRAGHTAPLSTVVQQLRDEVVQFTAGSAQADDLTAVLIRRQT